MRKNQTKELFLIAYNKTRGNASESCRQIKLSRSTYKKWLASDPAFAEAVDEIELSFIDFCEDKLKSRIENNEWGALKYWLENRAKTRWRNTDAGGDMNLSGQVAVHITKQVITGPVEPQK